jgi:2-desacetyl-2-hydroxyethyl bacteriochlorophyllide A dehydrogenase
MKDLAVTFTGANQVELVERDVDANLAGGEVLIESLYSAVSPGTEMACLSGRESWFTFPSISGYCNVGRAIAVGAGVTRFSPGDVIFSYGGHQRYLRRGAGDFALKVPAGLDLRYAPLIRLATVASTAIRVSDIEVGDDVAVVGLGPVGNLAAQLAALQGGRVVGIEPLALRRDVARACGVRQTVDPAGEDAAARIGELTGGRGVHSLIDATGNPKAVLGSLPWVGKYGELILLGSPRGQVEADVTDLLNYVHLWPRGCVTFKGAHEWRYPVYRDTFVKHSLERNTEIAWQLVQEGRLILDKLVTHVVSPYEAAAVYGGLADRKSEYMGVIFDWTTLH